MREKNRLSQDWNPGQQGEKHECSLRGMPPTKALALDAFDQILAYLDGPFYLKTVYDNS